MLDILNSLYDSKELSPNKAIIFYGEVTPNIVQRLIEKYPIIGGSTTTAAYYIYKLQNLSPYQLKSMKFRREQDKEIYLKQLQNEDDFLLVKDTRFYKIYSNSIGTVVEFKPFNHE